jgi:two-component system, chemotaxis family, response regulator Rcp1
LAPAWTLLLLVDEGRNVASFRGWGLPVPFLSLPRLDLVPLPVLLASEPHGRPPVKERSRGSDPVRDGGDADRQLFLIEDNAADVELVREALGGLPFAVGVSTAGDGEQALDILRDAANRGALPNVIFLDLNLPRMNGLEVLAQLKRHPVLRGVPVVVLTSSSAAKDTDPSHALRADEFVTKPIDVDEYFATVRATALHWFGRA